MTTKFPKISGKHPQIQCLDHNLKVFTLHGQKYWDTSLLQLVKLSISVDFIMIIKVRSVVVNTYHNKCQITLLVLNLRDDFCLYYPSDDERRVIFWFLLDHANMYTYVLVTLKDQVQEVADYGKTTSTALHSKKVMSL